MAIRLALGGVALVVFGVLNLSGHGMLDLGRYGAIAVVAGVLALVASWFVARRGGAS